MPLSRSSFLRTRPELASPDVQFHFLIFSADAAGAALHPFSGFMASVCQLRPESRGFVRIKSRDPAQAPAIQPRYLSARADCDCVVDGMKLWMVTQELGTPSVDVAWTTAVWFAAPLAVK